MRRCLFGRLSWFLQQDRLTFLGGSCRGSSLYDREAHERVEFFGSQKQLTAVGLLVFLWDEWQVGVFVNHSVRVLDALLGNRRLIFSLLGTLCCDWLRVTLAASLVQVHILLGWRDPERHPVVNRLKIAVGLKLHDVPSKDLIKTMLLSLISNMFQRVVLLGTKLIVVVTLR